jgi:hypothetical protein
MPNDNTIARNRVSSWNSRFLSSILHLAALAGHIHTC